MENTLANALRTLELIQVRPGIGGDELASRLGTSVRAVRRTVAALRQAGFTIASTPGPGGGYRVERGPRMPMVFTQEELTALAMSLVASSESLSDVAFTHAATKVLRAIPARAAAPARSVLDGAVAVPGGATTGAAPAIVLQLALAVEGCERVWLHHRSATTGMVERRLVEPWSLVVRHRRWYVWGRRAADGEMRIHRLDRVEGVEATGERFDRPEEVDVAHSVEEHLRTSWRHPTEVTIHAPVDAVRGWVPSTMGVLGPDGEDSCRLVGRTNNCTAYLTDLLQTPFPFVVTGGDHLLAAAANLHARLGDATSGV